MKAGYPPHKKDTPTSRPVGWSIHLPYLEYTVLRFLSYMYSPNANGPSLVIVCVSQVMLCQHTRTLPYNIIHNTT